MLQKQQKALERVANTFRREHKDIDHHDPKSIFETVWYTDEYAYACDTYQAYRVANDTNNITVSVKCYQPNLNMYNNLFNYDESMDKYSLNTDVVREDCNMNLVKIGHNYFDVKKIKTAIAILGKNAVAYQSKQNFAPIVIVSKDGKSFGAVCPVRVY